MLKLELDDIQGVVLRAYRLPKARYGFLRIVDGAAARRFLQRIVPHVTTAAPWPRGDSGRAIKPDSTLNLGFTHSGLAALGLPAGSATSFPVEFQEGMQARANQLGDTGSSSPERWDGVWREPVHIWVGVQAADDLRLADRAAWLARTARETGGVVEIGRQYAAALPGAKEHFGFTDGISDPDFVGLRASGESTGTRIGKLGPHGRWRPLAAGEFLLGHSDEAEETAAGPRPLGLARNGTFLVYRKLHQNVASFRRYLRMEGARFGNEELLAAKLVGRWRDGTPLALSPDAPDPSKVRDNSFTYADDPSGAKTPLGSHIRRTNPRDALGHDGVLVNRRRIIRRGLPYGDPVPDGPGDDDGEHGVIFMAINASIERQFEFVQSAWVNSGNSFGLGNDKDPITGDHSGRGRMVVQGQIAGDDVRPPYLLIDLPRFVETRGGDYFFLPGMNGLRMIVDGRVDVR